MSLQALVASVTVDAAEIHRVFLKSVLGNEVGLWLLMSTDL